MKQLSPGKRRPSPVRDALMADPDLGKITDLEMANRHGCGITHVWTLVRELGIKRNVRTMDQEIKADPDLGKISDLEVAERHGATASYVGKVRRMRKIPPPPSQMRQDPEDVEAALGALTDDAVLIDRIAEAAGLTMGRAYRALQVLCRDGRAECVGADGWDYRRAMR